MKNRILFILVFLSIVTCELYAKTIDSEDSQAYRKYESAQLSKDINERKHKVLTKKNKQALKEGKITKKEYKKNKKQENKRYKETQRLVKQMNKEALDAMLFEEEND